MCIEFTHFVQRGGLLIIACLSFQGHVGFPGLNGRNGAKVSCNFLGTHIKAEKTESSLHASFGLFIQLNILLTSSSGDSNGTDSCLIFGVLDCWFQQGF